jgi:prepilin-type N-terminal cleavage/methylation domain-containing protein
MKQKLSQVVGFTLIELMVVVAIIAIMSAGLLYGLSSYRQSAQESRALAELSSLIQPIMMCRSNGGSVNTPNGTAGSGVICTLAGNYGTWPVVGGTSSLSSFANYVADNAFNDGNWYFSTSTGTNKICCNSGSLKCANIPAASACAAATVLP